MNFVRLHREKYNKPECSANRSKKVESEITKDLSGGMYQDY
jgi:hypothetical protein